MMISGGEEMRIREVSEITGISVRNLQYYDDEGIVSPVRDSYGYRDYDEKDLAKLQQVLIFKYMHMELSEIKNIMNSPDYDPVSVLERQIHVLQAEKERLEYIIMSAEFAKGIGTSGISFSLLREDRLTGFMKEVMESPRYEDIVNRDLSSLREMMEELHEIAELFGRLKYDEPGSDEEEAAVERFSEWLRWYQSGNLPDPQKLMCCIALLSFDGAFSRYFDEIGGQGTAEFAAAAANRKYVMDFICEFEPVYELLKKRMDYALYDPNIEDVAQRLLEYLHRFIGRSFFHEGSFLKFSEEMIRECFLKECEEDPDLSEDKKIIEYALEILHYYGPKEKSEGGK